MDAESVRRLEARLDAIIRLLALPITQDRPIAESAPVLSQLGLDTNLIATLCGTSPTVVRTAIRRKRQPTAKNTGGQRTTKGNKR